VENKAVVPHYQTKLAHAYRVPIEAISKAITMMNVESICIPQARVT
jgi:hypothetical protein